jgi:hypothetical protein
VPCCIFYYFTPFYQLHMIFNVERNIECKPNITEKFRKCASTSSLIDTAYKENQEVCNQNKGRVYIYLYLLPTEKSNIACWFLDHFYRNITYISTLIFFVACMLLSSLLRNLTVHWHYVQIYSWTTCYSCSGNLFLLYCNTTFFSSIQTVENCRRPVWPAFS